MVTALITAGGKGTRLNSDTPKQFIEINGKPLIVYTLEKFQNNKNIDYIIISCLDGWKEYLLNLKSKYDISKLKWIASNGNTQPESIYNCVNILKENLSEDDIVIIHAGNRPLITDEEINKSIESCKKFGNAISAISCPEVLVTKSEQQIIKRENVLRVQTPQTFLFKILINYYKELHELDGVATTCDLMLKKGDRVNFIDGSPLNIKITYKEDIILFKALLESSEVQYEGKVN